MLKHFIILSLFFTFAFQTYATPKVSYDTSNVSVRKFSDSKIESFKSSKEFAYDLKVEEPETLWDRIKMWILQQFLKLFSNQGAAPYIRWGLILFFVIFLIIKILKTNLHSIFIGGRQAKKIDCNIINEDITKLDLNALIEDACLKRDFRLATRYLYLKLLKTLSDAEIIHWKLNKTNLDYLKEVGKTKHKEFFTQLTSTYEFIWYGNFSVSEASFQKINGEFTEFHNKI